GVWRPDLLAWVKAGGTLVAVVPPGEKLTAAGFTQLPEKRERKSFTYQPDQWMRKNLLLQESYQIDVDVFSKFQTALGHQDEFISVSQYGQGLIVVLGALCYVHAPWQYEEIWESYRKLLTDLCRGALTYHGKDKLARECLVDPSLGEDYLKMTSADGRLTVYVLHADQHGTKGSPSSFRVPGFDLVSGQYNALLSNEQPVVIIDHRIKAK
ncbi:MAG: hypothetical protein NC911_10925, partial [Candidatus Omnitrophica bacterium]|nr:hypothetical protein [Candidatus Omnitrophota bacterium]